MIVSVRTMLGAVALAACGQGLALTPDEARQYCEEIHPAEYYEPEQRKAYVDQCIADYTDPADDWDEADMSGEMQDDSRGDSGREGERRDEPPGE